MIWSKLNFPTTSSLHGATIQHIPTSCVRWSVVEPAALGVWGEVAEVDMRTHVCCCRSHSTISHHDEKCSARSVSVEQLDSLVWEDVCEVLTHPEMIEAALYRVQGGEWLPQELQARRENLRKARVSLEQQMERLTDAYLAECCNWMNTRGAGTN